MLPRPTIRSETLARAIISHLVSDFAYCGLLIARAERGQRLLWMYDGRWEKYHVLADSGVGSSLYLAMPYLRNVSWTNALVILTGAEIP